MLKLRSNYNRYTRFVRFVGNISTEYSNPSRQINDFIRSNQKIAQSSVFQGTLYELTVMKELANKLLMSNLSKVGGANDKGVDIIGDWNVNGISQKMNTLLKNNKDVKFLSERNPFGIFVQCKAFKHTKVSPRDLRELVGTYTALAGQSFFGEKDIANTKQNLIFMCSPNLLTPQGIKLINTVRIPIIYIRIQLLPVTNIPFSEEELNKNLGQLLNYYENIYAQEILQDCFIDNWLNLKMFEI